MVSLLIQSALPVPFEMDISSGELHDKKVQTSINKLCSEFTFWMKTIKFVWNNYNNTEAVGSKRRDDQCLIALRK